MKKPILYIDMDNVLVDFKTGIDRLPLKIREQYPDDVDIDDCPGIFALMEPMPGAIQAVHELAKKYEVYVLSTAPWNNPSAWSDKVKWLHLHFGKDKSNPLYKRLIISHNKNLNKGDVLIDDRPNNGAKDFEGKWIQFNPQNREEEWPRILGLLV